MIHRKVAFFGKLKLLSQLQFFRRLDIYVGSDRYEFDGFPELCSVLKGLTRLEFVSLDLCDIQARRKHQVDELTSAMLAVFPHAAVETKVRDVYPPDSKMLWHYQVEVDMGR